MDQGIELSLCEHRLFIFRKIDVVTLKVGIHYETLL